MSTIDELIAALEDPAITRRQDRLDAATILRQFRERGFFDEKGEARKSRMYWRYDADEFESGYDSPDEIGDACDVGEVFRVQVAVPLPPRPRRRGCDGEGARQ